MEKKLLAWKNTYATCSKEVKRHYLTMSILKINYYATA